MFNYGKIFVLSEIIKLIDVENGNLLKGFFVELILVWDGKVIVIGDIKIIEDVVRLIEVLIIDRINLEGKLVVFGFIDGYVYVIMMGSVLDWIDLINCYSVLDI